MNSIAFIDTEIETHSGRILDIGGVKDNGSSLHSNSVAGLIKFLYGTEYICGHNIFSHDLKYIQKAICDSLKEKLRKRHELVQFIMEYLYDKANLDTDGNEDRKEEVLVEFSVIGLKEAFEDRLTLFSSKTSIDEVEDALFYLSKIDVLKIEGGFMVTYNGLSIERLNGKMQVWLGTRY